MGRPEKSFWPGRDRNRADRTKSARRPSQRRPRSAPKDLGIETLEDRLLLANSLKSALPVSGGLMANYFDNLDFTNLKTTQVDAQINFAWAHGSPASGVAGSSYSVTWDGYVKPVSTGLYTFSMAHADGARVYVNNRLIIDSWADSASAVTSTGTVSLLAGQLYSLHIDYRDNADSSIAKLSWSGPGLAQQIIPSAQLFHDPNTRGAINSANITSATTGTGITLAGSPDEASNSWSVTYNGTPYGTGNAIKFDGASSAVTVPDSASLNPGSELTLQGQFKVDTWTNPWQTIFFKGTTPDGTSNFANREYALFVNQLGYLELTSTPVSRANVGQLYMDTATGLVQPGKWYQVTAVINSDFTNPATHNPAPYMALYLNGQLVAQQAYDASGIRTTSGALQFGNVSNSSYGFSGELDNFKYWNTALTATQIQTGQNVPPTVSSWNFDEPAGSSVVADQNQLNPGTLSGGVRVYSYQPSSDPSGQFFTFVPNSTGTYVVTDNAVANNGNADLGTKTLTITAANVATTILGMPVTSAEGIPVGTALSLSSMISDTDPLANDSYSWSVTRGNTIVATGASPTLTFLVDMPGSYTVTLNVTSSDGGTGATSQSFNVYAVPLEINLISATAPTSGGLRGTYYDNYDSTNPVVSRVDSQINFDWTNTPPDPTIGATTFGVAWDGFIKPLYTETYTFTMVHDDGARVFINGEPIIDSLADTPPIATSGTIKLVAGQLYPIHVEYRENGGSAIAQLYWSSLSQTNQLIPASQLFAPPPQAKALKTVAGGTLTAFGAFSAPGNETYTAVVDYGDASGSQNLPISGRTFSLSHTYASAGHYNITLTLTSSSGTVSSTTLANTVGYSGAVQAAGAIGYWPLGETSGTTAHDSIGGNNGTVVNPVIQGNPGPLPNGLDSSYQFSGGEVDLSVPGLTKTAGAYNTVSFWMKWDGRNGVMPFAFQNYDLWLVNGAFGFNTFNNDVWGISSIGLANNWVHVVAEFNNGDVTKSRLFIDGVERVLSQQAGTPVSRTATSTAQISGAPGSNGAWNFSGQLSEVALFAQGLTSAQVASLYAAAQPVQVNVGPSATFNLPSVVDAGASFVASLTNPLDVAGNLSSLLYSFDIGDGNGFGPFTSANSVTIPTSTAGILTVRAQIENPQGGVSVYSGLVRINPAQPLTVSAATGPVDFGKPYTLHLGSTLSGAQVPTSWTINWGDGTTQTVAGNPDSVKHSYPKGVGAYVISATATTAQGTFPAIPTATTTSNAAYDDAVLASDPVGFWALDDASGDVAQNLVSGGGSGHYIGNALLGVSGVQANAVNFDGSTAAVTTPVSLNGLGAFTLEAWIRPTGVSSSRTGIMGQNDALEFSLSSGNTLSIWTPATGSFSVPYNVPLGQWAHVAAVGTGTKLQIYINGQLAGSVDHSNVSASGYGSSQCLLHVGGAGILDPSGNVFNGDIADAAVYAHALSASDIQSHFLAATSTEISSISLVSRSFADPNNPGNDPSTNDLVIQAPANSTITVDATVPHATHVTIVDNTTGTVFQSTYKIPASGQIIVTETSGNNQVTIIGSLDAVLYGGSGSDVLVGGAGDDTLYAGSGNEILSGGAGHNTIIGYTGPNGGVDLVSESGNYDFFLTDGYLEADSKDDTPELVTADTLTDISNVFIAATGVAGKTNFFTVAGWSGIATLEGGVGTNSFDVSLTGAGSGSTTINGNGTGSDRLFVHGTSGENDLSLSASTLALFNPTGAESVDYAGVPTLGIFSAGPQVFEGPVTLGANTSVQTTGTPTNITFGGTVDGNYTLMVDASGTATYDDVVGGATPLVSLSDFSAGIKIHGGSITTTNEQVYFGPVSFDVSTTLTGSSVTFDSTVQDGAVGGDSLGGGAGSDDLTIVGDAFFCGIVSSLNNLSVSGTSDINADITTNGTQTYGDVTIGLDATLTASAVTFGGTLDDDEPATENLEVVAQTVTFDGLVGSISPLASIWIVGSTILGAGATGISASDYLLFDGPVQLNGDTTLTASTVNFKSTVDGGFDLTIDGSAQFNGAVGASDPLAAIAVHGFAEFHANVAAASLSVDDTANLFSSEITTTGLQQYLGSVLIDADVTLSASLVKFGSTVGDGNGAGIDSLSIDGDAEFAGIVGGMNDGVSTALYALDVTGSTTFADDATAVTTTGEQDYEGPVWLSVSTVLNAELVGFFSTVDDGNDAGTDSLTVLGSVVFLGNVGAAAALASLMTSPLSELDTTGIYCDEINTTGAQDYHAAVLIGSAATLAGSLITFFSTVDDGSESGTSSLTVNGDATFQDAVGAGAALHDLTVTGATTIDTDTITTGDSQTYSDAVTIDVSTTLTAPTVTFGGTVGDGNAAGTDSLTISGNAVFEGIVGGTVGGVSTALSALAVSGGATFSPSASAISTTGTQSYTGPVIVGTDTTLTAPNIIFSSTVDDAVAGTNGLSIVGDVDFEAAVGSIAQLGSLSINGTPTFGSGATAISTSKAGGATGNQSYSVLPLTAPLILATAGGSLSFAGPVTGASGTNLSINAGSGDVTFWSTIDGAFQLTISSAGATTFMGVVGGTTPLAQIVTDQPGSTVLSASLSTAGGMTFNDPVYLNADVTLIDTGTPSTGIKFNGTIDSANPLSAHALTVESNNTKTFNGNVGSQFPLLSLTTKGDPADTVQPIPLQTVLDCASISTTGDQTYDHALLYQNLNVVLLSGGAISFASLSAGKAGAALTVTIDGDSKLIDLSEVTVPVTVNTNFTGASTSTPQVVKLGSGSNNIVFGGTSGSGSGSGGGSGFQGSGSGNSEGSFSPINVVLVPQGNQNTLDFSQTLPVQVDLTQNSGQSQNLFVNTITPGIGWRFGVTADEVTALQQSTLALQGAFQTVVGGNNDTFTTSSAYSATDNGLSVPQSGTQVVLNGSGNTVYADLGTNVVSFAGGNHIIQSGGGTSYAQATSFAANVSETVGAFLRSKTTGGTGYLRTTKSGGLGFLEQIGPASGNYISSSSSLTQNFVSQVGGTYATYIGDNSSATQGFLKKATTGGTGFLSKPTSGGVGYLITSGRNGGTAYVQSDSVGLETYIASTPAVLNDFLTLYPNAAPYVAPGGAGLPAYVATVNPGAIQGFYDAYPADVEQYLQSNPTVLQSTLLSNSAYQTAYVTQNNANIASFIAGSSDLTTAFLKKTTTGGTGYNLVTGTDGGSTFLQSDSSGLEAYIVSNPAVLNDFLTLFPDAASYVAPGGAGLPEYLQNVNPTALQGFFNDPLYRADIEAYLASSPSSLFAALTGSGGSELGYIDQNAASIANFIAGDPNSLNTFLTGNSATAGSYVATNDDASQAFIKKKTKGGTGFLVHSTTGGTGYQIAAGFDGGALFLQLDSTGLEAYIQSSPQVLSDFLGLYPDAAPYVQAGGAGLGAYVQTVNSGSLQGFFSTYGGDLEIYLDGSPTVIESFLLANASAETAYVDQHADAIARFVENVPALLSALEIAYPDSASYVQPGGAGLAAYFQANPGRLNAFVSGNGNVLPGFLGSNATVLGLLAASNSNLLQNYFTANPSALGEYLSSTPSVLESLLTSNTTLLENFVTANPDVLGAFLASQPTILQQYVSGNLGAFATYLTSDPTILANFVASDPAVLGSYLSADESVLELFLSSNSSLLVDYLTSNPTVLQNFIASDPTALQQFLTANPQALETFLGSDPDFLNQFFTGATLSMFRLNVTLAGSGNTATGGLLSSYTLGDNSSFTQAITQSQLDLVSQVISSGTSLSDIQLNVSVAGDGGGGNNVLVGGLLANYTAGSGNTRFVVEDPSLLGLPSNTAIPAQALQYGGTFTGGGGNDTYYFVGGSASNSFGKVTLNEGTGSGAASLDFSNFLGGGINLELGNTSPQQINSKLNLTLPSTKGITNVLGTPASDVITGNSLNNVISGAAVVGPDPLDNPAPSTPPSSFHTEWVYLDFTDHPTPSVPVPGTTPHNGTGAYSASDISAILAGLENIYAQFTNTVLTTQYLNGGLAGLTSYLAANPNALQNSVVQFTTDVAVAQAMAPKDSHGDPMFETVYFNSTPTDSSGNPQPGGLSQEIDFRNLNLNTTVQVDINGFLGSGNGLVPDTTSNFDNLSIVVAAHEVGHTLGLEHEYSFGPISFGMSNPPGQSSYNPGYPGPVGAFGTGTDVIASPASVGSTLADAASGQVHLGERDAVILAFIEGGTVIDGTAGDLVNGVAVKAHNSSASAMPVGPNGGLYKLNVPNPITSGFDAGKTFDVAAVDITGKIASGAPLLDANGNPVYEKDIHGNLILDGSNNPIAIVPANSDYYSFHGQAGDLMNFQVLSAALTRNSNSIDSVLQIYGPDGQLVPYYSGHATADDTFEFPDASIVDLTLPATGTYVVKVSSFSAVQNPDGQSDPNYYKTLIDPASPNYNPGAYYGTHTGSYELFMYRFAAYNATSGNDTMLGGAGDDTFLSNTGNNNIDGGAGTNTVVVVGQGGYNLSGSQLITPGGTDTLSSIQQASLTDNSQAGGNTFTITPSWGGSATLYGTPGNDILNAPGSLNGTTTVTTTLSQINVGQDITGTLNVLATFAGTMNVVGSVNTVNFGQNLSGSVTTGGGIGTLTIAGSETSTAVITTASITNLTVGTANTPVAGENLAGRVIASGAISNISVSGNLSGLVQETGTVANLYVGGSITRSGVTNPTSSFTVSATTINVLNVGQNVSGTINAGTIGVATILGSLTNTGIINATSISNLTIGSPNTPIPGSDLAGKVIVAGTLSTLSVSGNLIGLVQEAGTIQTLYVGGSIVHAAAGNPGAGTNVSAGNITILNVGINLSGTLDVTGNVTTATIGYYLLGAMNVGGDLNSLTISRSIGGTLNVAGNIGALTVAGWLGPPSAAPPGSPSVSAGSITTLTVGVDLTGSVATTGNIASATIGGSLNGAITAGAGLDSLNVTRYITGTVTVTGDVGTLKTGLDVTGAISVTGNITTLNVGADLKGTISATGNINTAIIGHYLQGAMTVGGDLHSLNMSRSIGGTINVAGNIGALTVGGSIAPPTAAPGTPTVSAGSITTLTVGADLTGSIATTGNIASATIGGNLAGAITAGAGLNALSVSRFITGTVSVTGDLGTLNVGLDVTGAINATGNITTATIAHYLTGAMTVGGDVNSLTISRSIGGTINVAGNIGALTVAGWLAPPTAAPAGTPTVLAGSITTLNVGVDLTGTVKTTGKIASATISGSLNGAITAGAGLDSLNVTRFINGTVTVTGDLGTLNAGLDVTGTISATGNITTATLSSYFLGAMTVGGDLDSLNVARSIGGTINVTENIGALTVAGWLGPPTAAPPGTPTVSAGSITALKVGVDLTGSVATTGDIASATIGGNLTGSIAATGNFASATIGGSLNGAITAGAGLGSLNVTRYINGTVAVTGVLGTLKAGLDVTGTISATGNITTATLSNYFLGAITVGGDLDSLNVSRSIGGTINVAGNIGALTVGGSIAPPTAAPSGTPTVSAGSITTLKVGVDLTGSVATTGNIASATIGGSLSGAMTAGAGLDSLNVTRYINGTVAVTGDIGTLKAGLDVAGTISATGNITTATLSNYFLGAITVGGDLDSLNVSRSVGGTINVAGNIGALTVAGWLGPPTAAPLGTPTVSAGSITALKVGVDLTGSVDVSGSITTATIGGNLAGTISVGTDLLSLSVSQNLTGTVSASGTIGVLSVSKSIGPAGVSSTANVSASTIFTLSVGADLSGQVVTMGTVMTATVSRYLSGTLTVGGDLHTLNLLRGLSGNVSVTGDLGTFSATGWDSGTLVVGGNATTVGITRDLSGSVAVTGNIGTLTVGTASLPGSITTAGSVTAAAISALTVGAANKAIVANDLAGTVNVSGTLAKLSVSGNLKGTVIESGTMLSAFVGGSLSGTLMVGQDLNTLTVGQNLAGTVYESGNLAQATIGGAIPLVGNLIVGANLTSLTVGQGIGGTVGVQGNVGSLSGQTRLGSITSGGSLTGTIVVLGNLYADVQINGSLSGGSIAVHGGGANPSGIVGNLTITGGLDPGSAIASRGEIGDQSLGTVIKLGSANNGIVAGYGQVNSSTSPISGNVFSNVGFTNTTDAVIDAKVIDAIFTYKVLPPLSHLFDQTTPGDLKNLAEIIQNVKALQVTGGILQGREQEDQ